MLVRRTLLFAVGALVAAVVLTVLWNVSLGAGEQFWNTGLDVGRPTLGDIVFSYMQWGRWADVATVALFFAVLVVAPFLPGIRRASHILVAGCAVALVGDLVDLSQFASLNADTGLSPEELAAALTASRHFGFSTDPTSMYIWAGGILLMAVGLLILSIDAERKRWSRASAILGVAFGVMALTGINLLGGTAVFGLASWIGVGACMLWLVTALKVTAGTGDSTASTNRNTLPSAQ